MLREVGPTGHARDPVTLHLPVPGLVEQKHAYAGLRQPLRDDDIVLAERVELELLRKTHLVLGRTGGVVAAAGILRSKVAHRLQMHRLRVIEDPLFAEPRLGDVAAAFGARGDEVELVTGSHEALQDRRAILVDLELSEEGAVVQADPELIALFGCYVLEAGDDGVVARAALLLRQKMPADLALVGKLNVEFLREAAQIRDGADRHDVVEVDADLHATARSVQRPTRMTALKTQCAATLVASVPVATRKAAITRPPAKTTTSAPSAAGMTSTTG